MSGAAPERRTGVIGFAHVGLVVDDLDEAVAFLELLGLCCSEPSTHGGAWIDRIIGLHDTRIEIVMVTTAAGDDVCELVRFDAPAAEPGETLPPVNRLGLRHIAFTVADMAAVVDRVRAAGCETVGEIVNYEDVFLLCYVRGPAGVIVELAERLGDAGE